MGIHVPEPRLDVPGPSAEALAYAEKYAFRIVVECMIEDLIGILDAMDAPTLDLEEGDGYGHPGSRETVDDENSLAATEAINQDHAWTQGITERWHGCADLEIDDADDEPSLGSVNMSEHDQTRWAASSTSDIEEENEHGTEIDRGELDETDYEDTLGAATGNGNQEHWNQGGNQDRELDDADLERGGDEEPNLGSRDACVDQGGWSSGNTVDLELEDYGRLVRRTPDLPLSNLTLARPGVLLWKGRAHV